MKTLLTIDLLVSCLNSYLYLLLDFELVLACVPVAAQMHALALKDKEEEHAGLLHTASEIQVLQTCNYNCVFIIFGTV